MDYFLNGVAQLGVSAMLILTADRSRQTIHFFIEPISRCSVASIVTRDDPGFESLQGKYIFPSPKLPDCILGPPIPWISGALPPLLKRQERDADHSLLVLRLRMSGDTPKLPLYVFVSFTRTSLPFTPKVTPH
jgi:hypothetical protein